MYLALEVILMEWDKIEVFYNVAVAGSFTEAAGILHISQSALSRSVIKLEEQIGKRLFIRQAKGGLTFTREGKMLFELAEKMVQDICSTKKILQGQESDICGDLRILTTPSVGAVWLIHKVPSFLEQYPNINLHVEGILGDFKLHESDAMITTFLPHQPEFIQIPIQNFNLKLYASEKYIEKWGHPKTPENLNKHRLLVFEQNKSNFYGNTNWILNVGNTANHIRKPYLTINSTIGLYNAAQEGLGIVALAKQDPNVINSNLIDLFPTLSGPEVNIFYIYRKIHENISKIKVFGEFLSKK